MAKSINKIVYGNQTLIDLTNTTLSSNLAKRGYDFYDATGSLVSGTLDTITVYSGTDEPSDSLGSDGDIYIRRK